MGSCWLVYDLSSLWEHRDEQTVALCGAVWFPKHFQGVTMRLWEKPWCLTWPKARRKYVGSQDVQESMGSDKTGLPLIIAASRPGVGGGGQGGCPTTNTVITALLTLSWLYHHNPIRWMLLPSPFLQVQELKLK